MEFKRDIKFKDRRPITHWLGDSQVWMKTAIERDKASGRGQSGVKADMNELNVAHVCAGLAFELVLKALAKSEGRPVKAKHEALKNFGALSKKSQESVSQIVKTHTSNTVEGFLEYLDERMCHPDRKYSMVGRKGEAGPLGFVNDVAGLVIPDIAKVHAAIAQMVGENTFERWREEMRPKVGPGPLMAIGRFQEDGTVSFDVTEFGKRMGMTTGSAKKGKDLVLCPQCASCDWIMNKQDPDPDDRVTCRRCQATMRAGDVLAWNMERAGQENSELCDS